MFKKLFKPKWQSAKPQVRIQAVSQLNAADNDDLHTIELLAKNDVEADVRLAAVLKITQQEKLLAIVQQERNPDARIKMIEHLITNKTHPTLSHKIYYSRQVDCELVTGRGTIHSL